MSEIKFSNFKSEDGSTGPDLVGITTFTSPYYFVPPSGTTAQRPSNPVPGMLRFNTDIGRLEVWRNDHWATILGESPNLGISTAAAPASSGTGARGVIAGGNTTPISTEINIIEYVNISTLGNSIDFGDFASGTARRVGACASSTRGLFAGGYRAPAYSNTIDFVTIASTGNAQDFGDLIQVRWSIGGLSSSTRGIFAGGYDPGVNYNIIEYVTIASVGNTQDFGDLTRNRRETASFSSSTRGVWGGGRSPVPAGVNNNENIIDYITISTTGNAIDFGDLLTNNTALAGSSNATRGIFFGGYVTPAASNTIQFITISSTGNAQDFGDLTLARFTNSSCSSSIRGLNIGGSPTTNVIDYVTITTTGDAQDFGDLIGGVRQETSACSNAHGGL